MAGSGMCDGGRIRNYLKSNLSVSKNKLLLVSFQAEGTLGRLLAQGAKEVKIDREKVKVRAEVSSLSSFSSHADQGQFGRMDFKDKESFSAIDFS